MKHAVLIVPEAMEDIAEIMEFYGSEDGGAGAAVHGRATHLFPGVRSGGSRAGGDSHFPRSPVYRKTNIARSMTLRQFYDWQTLGGAKDVMRLVAALEEREISWCMIGGLAVNHWAAEPMATADVDLVIASEKIEEAAEALRSLGFSEERFKWSINFKGESKVSIQIRTEAMYLEFPSRSVPAYVHDIFMHVASLEDTLAGKLAAYLEPERRKAKKLKDILDIGRLVDAHPELAETLPPEVLYKLENP